VFFFSLNRKPLTLRKQFCASSDNSPLCIVLVDVQNFRNELVRIAPHFIIIIFVGEAALLHSFSRSNTTKTAL